MNPPSRLPVLRRLALAWAFTVASMIAFSWMATDDYRRIALSPYRSGPDLMFSVCLTDRCEPSPEWQALARVRTVAELSAWSLTGLAAVILLVATVHLLGRRHSGAARFLTTAWKVQAVVAVLLLGVLIAVLFAGHRATAGLPESALSATAAARFESPLTDVANLRHLGWHGAVATLATVLTVSLRDAVAQLTRRTG